MRVCVYEGCDFMHKARGYCRLHYDRLRNQGTPEHNKNSIGRAQQRHNHPLTKTYKNMVQRCNNPNKLEYVNYGGRGIKVCERWSGVDGFRNFVNDMGEKPSPLHSVDRINNDGDYEPSNCRWATRLEQNNNQRMRRDNTTGYIGVNWNAKARKWQARGAINKVEHYLGFYDTKEEAIQARQKFDLMKGSIL